MKKITCTTAILATLALTACGSGGSGSGVAPNPQALAQPTAIAGVLADGATQSGNKAITSADGKAYTYTYNGKTVDLTMSGVSSPELAVFSEGGASGTTKVIGGTTYSYSRFGQVSNNSGSPNVEIFYTGTPTANMPASGTAVYKGLLIAGEFEGKLMQGDIQFDVSFANKTISGQYAPDIDLLDIYYFQDGHITGNSFVGDIAFKSDPVSGKFQGQFFGPKAEEMAGLAIIKDGNHAGAAVFGAQKQ